MRFTTRIWNGRGLLAGAALVAALSLGVVAPSTPSLADELALAPEETTLAEEPASEDGETEDAGDDLGVNSVTSIAEKDDTYLITVKADTFAQFTELDFRDFDAVLSDNFFDISSPEGVTVSLKKSDVPAWASSGDVLRGLIIRSVADSYELPAR